MIKFNPNIEQTSSTGRPYRVVGQAKLNFVDSEWNAFIKHDYAVRILYLDDNTNATLKVNSDGKVLEKLA